MTIEQLSDLIAKIVRNRRSGRPYEVRLATHEKLIKKLEETKKKVLKLLEAQAFDDRYYAPCKDPVSTVQEGIKNYDSHQIKQGAYYGYKTGNYTALRLAAQFDLEMWDLLDYLETFGPMAGINQQTFLKVALAPPEPNQ